MKKVIGWPAVWILYGAGHVLSRPLMWWDWADCLAPVLYPPYNWCMIASGYAQDWAGLKSPWRRVNVE